MKVVYTVITDVTQEDITTFNKLFEKYGGVLKFFPDREQDDWFLKIIEGVLKAQEIEDKLMSKIGEEFIEEWMSKE